MFDCALQVVNVKGRQMWGFPRIVISNRGETTNQDPQTPVCETSAIFK